MCCVINAKLFSKVIATIESSKGNETCQIISLENEHVLCHWMRQGCRRTNNFVCFC